MKFKKIWFFFLFLSLFSSHTKNVTALDPSPALIISGAALILYDYYPNISTIFLQQEDLNDPAVVKLIKGRNGIFVTDPKILNYRDFFSEKEKFNFSHYCTNPQQFAINNKCSICGLGLILYGSLLRKLNNGKKLLYQKWASWKNAISMETFYEMPENELLRELETSICNHYHDNYPFATFLSDVNNEINNLERFINFTSFLNKTFLYLIFPSFEENYLQAHEIIEKLRYMEELISSKNVQEKKYA